MVVFFSGNIVIINDKWHEWNRMFFLTWTNSLSYLHFMLPNIFFWVVTWMLPFLKVENTKALVFMYYKRARRISLMSPWLSTGLIHTCLQPMKALHSLQQVFDCNPLLNLDFASTSNVPLLSFFLLISIKFQMSSFSQSFNHYQRITINQRI